MTARNPEEHPAANERQLKSICTSIGNLALVRGRESRGIWAYHRTGVPSGYIPPFIAARLPVTQEPTSYGVMCFVGLEGPNGKPHGARIARFEPSSDFSHVTEWSVQYALQKRSPWAATGQRLIEGNEYPLPSLQPDMPPLQTPDDFFDQLAQLEQLREAQAAQALPSLQDCGGWPPLITGVEAIMLTHSLGRLLRENPGLTPPVIRPFDG